MGAGEAIRVVATKLTAPTPPSRIAARPALEATLDHAVSDDRVRVVLVSAPAGSGKSTLVATWQQHRTDCAWLQADSADGDPARFWGHVVAALDVAVPGVEAATAAAIPRSGADATELVERLANELASDTPVVLVIDDYHLVSNPAIDKAVERLIELAPATFTIVLCTRLDPSVRLGRLRVRGELAEIRANDLRFAPDAAAVLLTQQGAAPSNQQIDALCARTEGWAAGLVLAGMSLAAADDGDAFVASFQGDDRLVVEYLTDEFLAGVSDDDRARLLQTSVLDRMCGPLIDAVCDSSGGSAWLDSTASTNQLVISLDRTGAWYRYHHLFGDLLRLEAERQIPDRIAELHLVAAQWHQAHDDVYRAIHHYLAGDDLVTAGDLIAIHATSLLNDGQIFTVLGLLEQLGDLPERHSRSAVTKGWLNYSTGRFATARHYCDVAATHDDGSDANLIAALGIMVNLAEGHLGPALSLAATMSDPTESTQALGLATVHTWAGKFDDARRHIAIARELGAAEPSDYVASVAPGLAAIVDIESGSVAAAARHASASLEHAADRGIADMPQLSISHAVVARTTADPELRSIASQRAVELIQRAPEPFTFGYVLALVGDAACENGDPIGPALLHEAQIALKDCADTGIAGRMLARVTARHGLADRSALRSVGAELVEELTDRELAVLHYLPSPMSQREIASELYVSLNTVKTHCKAIYRKLAVGNRKAAVQAGRDFKLL